MSADRSGVKQGIVTPTQTEEEQRRRPPGDEENRGDLTGGVPTPGGSDSETPVGGESPAGEEPFIPRERGVTRIETNVPPKSGERQPSEEEDREG